MSEIQTRLAETLRNAARKLALAVAAAALPLVGAGYVLIGLWLGLNRFLGPIGASFLLGAFFLLVSLVPLSLVGLLSILIGEQIVPVARHLLEGSHLAATWRQSHGTPHIFGLLPGRHEQATQLEIDSKQEKST